MKHLATAVSAIALLSMPSLAEAQQSTVLSTGTPIAHHVGAWQSGGFNGISPVLGDAGPVGSPNPSSYISDLPIVGTGLPVCIYDALISSSVGYHKLCFGANNGGYAQIVVDAGGGASVLPLQAVIGGTVYNIPATGTGLGNVTGPNSTTDNQLALWSGTTGQLLKAATMSGDCTLSVAVITCTKSAGQTFGPLAFLAAGSIRTMLTASLNYYVSPSGNDANACSIGAKCQTLQHVVDLISATDLNGHGITVNIADGSYTGFTFSVPAVGMTAGNPNLISFLGNVTTPGNVVITGSDAIQAYGVAFTIQGATLVGNGDPLAGFGVGLLASAGANINFSKITFATCNGAHMQAQLYGQINALAGAQYNVTGNAKEHINVSTQGVVQVTGASIQFTGGPAFSVGFVVSQLNSTVVIASMSFNGVASGKRFVVATASTIETATGGANVDNAYLPGTIAGTSSGTGWYD